MTPRLSFTLGAGLLTLIALIAALAGSRNASNSADADGANARAASSRAAAAPRETLASETARELALPEEAALARSPADEAAQPAAPAVTEVAPAAQDSNTPVGTQPSLTRAQLKDRLRACRDLRRELHANGGAAEFAVAFQNALLAIAIELDSTGRGSEALGKSVSLTNHDRRQHRFVSNGKLYVFDCAEFSGFEALRKGANDSRKLAHDELDATRVPDELIRSLEALTDRAIEFLER